MQGPHLVGIALQVVELPLAAAVALEQLDLPPIMAVTLYSAFFIVILTTIADLVQAALDPRVRLGRAR